MPSAPGKIPLEKAVGVGSDMVPITASTTNNWAGKTVNVVQGTGDMRAAVVWCDGATTFSGYTANGNLRSNIISQGGAVPCQFIQITAISGGTMKAII